MAKGAVWTILMRCSVRSIGLVSTIILARLLVPEDFGLVAIASMMVALLEQMSRFNFGTFLIREQETTRSHYDTVWTLMTLRGVFTAAMLVIGAPLIVIFFEDVRLEYIVYVMAGTCVISGLENIGIVDFQKHLQFDKDFQLEVRTKLAAFAITIILAITMRNYWALVLGTLSSQIVRLVFSYIMHPYRPKFSLEKSREIMTFSVWLLANNILFFVQRRSDFAIIAKLLDATSLGLYSIAREIASLATSEIIRPIQRVMLPGLSKINNDREQVLRTFLDGLAVAVMLGLPLAAGIGLTADPLVRLALGAKWTGAIPLLQILVIVSLMRVCSSNTNALFLALNQPRLTTFIAMFGVAVGVPLILLGAWYGEMIGAAWAASATETMLVPVIYTIIWRKFALSPIAVIAAIWRSLIACLVMAGTVYALLEFWSQPEGAIGLFLELLFAAVIGAISYIAAHLILWRLSGSSLGAESYALSAIRKSFDQIRTHGVLH